MYFVDAAGKEEKKLKKFVYTFSEDINQTVVIHYQLDDSIAINSALHVRALPSIMRQLESTETTPSVAYKRMVAIYNRAFTRTSGCTITKEQEANQESTEADSDISHSQSRSYCRSSIYDL